MLNIALIVALAAIFLVAGLATTRAVTVLGRQSPRTARRHSPVRAWTEAEIYALGKAMLEEGAIELWSSDMAHHISCRRPSCSEKQMRLVVSAVVNDRLWSRRGVRPYGR